MKFFEMIKYIIKLNQDYAMGHINLLFTYPIETFILSVLPIVLLIALLYLINRK